jgi:hypothetical protein
MLKTNSQHSDQQNAQYCFLDIYIIIAQNILCDETHYMYYINNNMHFVGLSVVN